MHNKKWAQETFWGRYFSAGKRDPQQMCPAPFVRKYFAQMFKDVKCLGNLWSRNGGSGLSVMVKEDFDPM